jgi:hypothetical protein
MLMHAPSGESTFPPKQKLAPALVVEDVVGRLIDPYQEQGTRETITRAIVRVLKPADDDMHYSATAWGGSKRIW